MAITVFARGDSSTANNDDINLQNTNKTPVTELEFSATVGGDVVLEPNGGNPDPDTILTINGVSRPFTVEFSGHLPNTDKFESVAGVDVRGSQIVVITDSLTGQRYVFLTDPQLNSPEIAAELPNGSITVAPTSDDPVEICFAAGTLISTPDGPQAVETIRPGTFVDTDAGPQPVLWAGANPVAPADLRFRPDLRPVRIEAGALGPGCPDRPLTLSPDHRVCIRGPRVELLTGHPEVLCAAKFLDGPGISRPVPAEGVVWCHLLLPTHRLLLCHGLRAESLSQGARARTALGRAGVALADLGLDLPSPPPRPILKAWEVRALRPALA